MLSDWLDREQGPNVGELWAQLSGSIFYSLSKYRIQLTEEWRDKSMLAHVEAWEGAQVHGGGTGDEPCLRMSLWRKGRKGKGGRQ